MSVTTATGSSAYKKAILRFGIGFLIVILLLTFFSQTLNNIALAKVSVESPAANSLQKVITANGSFAPKQIVNVMLTATGKVSEVDASVGDVVKAGDTLVKMDMTDLQNQITTEQNNLQVMLNNQAKQLISTPADYTQLNIQIANDKQAVTDAQTQLNTDTANSASADVITKDKAALKAAQDKLKVDQANLSHQKKQDSNSKKSSALDQANTDINIQAEETKISTLQQELIDNQVVKAPVDGRVQSLNAVVGQQGGTSQPIATMLDTAKGLTFSFDVTSDDAQNMPAGTQMDIHLTGSSASVSGTVTEVKDSTANPGVNSTITLDADTQGVLNNNVQPNQKGDIRFSVYTNTYNTTVSNGAVREDSSGYFVLVVQQKTTPLGKAYVARRVDVDIVDSDSYHSAVSGSLRQNDQVISSSDKNVSDGDTVRIAQ